MPCRLDFSLTFSSVACSRETRPYQRLRAQRPSIEKHLLGLDKLHLERPMRLPPLSRSRQICLYVQHVIYITHPYIFIDALGQLIGNDNAIRTAKFMRIIMENENHSSTNEWHKKPLDNADLEHGRPQLLILSARWVERQRVEAIHIQSSCMSE